MTDEQERRRWFHGWAFEGGRTAEQKAALRVWLWAGAKFSDELSPKDLARIEQFEREGSA